MVIHKFEMDEREKAVKVLKCRDPVSVKRLSSLPPTTWQCYRDIVGEKWYKSHVESLPFKSRSLSLKNPIINDIVYTMLNKEQRSVFKDLHTAISESYGSENKLCVKNPKILVLDSPSGTGKSVLLMLLSMTLDKPMISIVYSAAIKHIMKPYVNVTTYYNFLKRVANKPLEVAKNMFYDDIRDRNGLEMGLRFWNEAIKAREDIEIEIEKPQVLILEEYTRFSPWFLYFLLVYAYVKRINLLFVGDRDQLDAIDVTVHHNTNNYTLVSYIADRVFSLSKQVRMEDEPLISLVSTFQEKLKFRDLTMPLKYPLLVYRTYPKNFFLSEDFENSLFFSHYHYKIAKRTLRFLDHLKSKHLEGTKIEGQDWHKAPYYLELQSTLNSEITKKPFNMDNVSQKFLPFLLLAKGCRYFYVNVDEGHRKTVVRYLHRGEGEKLNLLNEESGKIFTLEPEEMTKKYFLDNRVKWLKKQAKKMLPKGAHIVGIWQYSLIPYCSTYHGAQALEISRDNIIELDIDVKDANSIYVGLTRLNNSSQLGKIHSELLPSLILTNYFDDAYYYKVDRLKKMDFCDRLVQETRTYYENNVPTESRGIVYSSDLGINELQFQTTDNLKMFNKKGNWRIERRLFDEETLATAESQKAKMTRLMDLCKFVQHVFATKGAAAGKTYKNESFCEMYKPWDTVIRDTIANEVSA